MKKKWLCLYYITLVVICQGVVLGAGRAAAAELTDEQRTAIIDHCDAIRENLRYTQRDDSRSRVYLGRYYETILSKFMTPLNLRLVENNLSDTKLIENQGNFAARRGDFVNDFIAYSQALEETIGVDCKREPERFYEKLSETRKIRKRVNSDVKKLRELTEEQIKLVGELEGKI